MKLQRCEMCSKETKRIEDHHVIPWRFSHDDSDSNIIRICRSCHNKADANFVNLIMYGKMNVRDDTSKRVHHRYEKKYKVYKTLYNVRLLKNTYYQDTLRYNIKTGYASISHSWHYIKRRPSIGSIINIHRRAKKAAALKGQTTLPGILIRLNLMMLWW